MLPNTDLETLASDLASGSDEDSNHHNNVHVLLSKFRSLLEEYTTLKSDHEEVKERREKYKRQPRSQVRTVRLAKLSER